MLSRMATTSLAPLPQGRLRPAPLGHVAEDREVAAGEDVGGGGILRLAGRAVGPDQAESPAGRRGRGGTRPRPPGVEPRFGEVGHRPAEQLPSGQAEEGARGGVGVDVAAGVVGQDQRVQGPVEDRPELPLAGPERRLGPVPLGDVQADADGGAVGEQDVGPGDVDGPAVAGPRREVRPARRGGAS